MKYYSVDHPTRNLHVFIAFTCVVVVVNITSCMLFFAALVKCSRRLHEKMFESLLYSPIYFFDTNSPGTKKYHISSILSSHLLISAKPNLKKYFLSSRALIGGKLSYYIKCVN